MADTVDAKRVREYNEEDTPDFEEKLDKLAAMVKASKYTVFYTGAGISTSAGVGKRFMISISSYLSYCPPFRWLSRSQRCLDSTKD